MSSFDAAFVGISVKVLVLSCGNELFKASGEIYVKPKVWRALPSAEILGA